jgi:predicted Co/Zn/Cd cation transporter (cation efflux family)
MRSQASLRQKRKREQQMRQVEVRGRLEQYLLITSIGVTLLIGAMGLVFGFLTGSFAIMFDGVYATIDASMAALGLGVARLILKDALRTDDDAPENARGGVRYQYGFWHLEPMVLALNATMLTLAAAYALVSAIMLILEGGTEIEFDLALPYALVVACVCFGMAWRQRARNRSLGSAFVALDAKGWLISGSITTALLVGFAAGYALDGTRHAWMRPYVDPVVLAAVCLVVLPLPFSDLRAALAGILRVAPEDLDAHVRGVAARASARHGFVDDYTYVARVGRATLIEITFITPPGWAITSIAQLDRIRQEVGEAVGGKGPDRWLTIAFTEDPDWAF